jgi:gliding motility-associated-like protein
MRKFVLVVISVIFSVLSYALNVECVGNAEQLVNDGDTLFLFENNPEIKSKIGMIDWYRLPDTITAVQSGTDYLYPEHGAGYMIKNGATREYFWVFDYDSLRVQIDNITAKLTCENTELTIDGKIPSMQYHNVVGKLCKYVRLCQVIYLDKQWESDGWIDSTAVSQTTLQSTINVGASPVATDFTIVDHLAVLLEIEGDSIRTMTYDPVALKAHPQALVTTRPNDKSNEVERPVDPETLIRRSAPLEVEFKANALNTEYYKWTLYQGSEEFLTRNEAQHKYNFQQPGNYRAALEMTNSHGCSCQSEDFDVSVSESMLIVPNVFTPNGDGTHDEFRVVYRSLKEFHCWIYNRWGHLVYKWDDPAKGWDGTIHGRPAAAGAYYYVIRALGTDADVDYMSKPKYSKKLKKGELPMGVYQLSGDINLLR